MSHPIISRQNLGSFEPPAQTLKKRNISQSLWRSTHFGAFRPGALPGLIYLRFAKKRTEILNQEQKFSNFLAVFSNEWAPTMVVLPACSQTGVIFSNTNKRPQTHKSPNLTIDLHPVWQAPETVGIFNDPLLHSLKLTVRT